MHCHDDDDRGEQIEHGALWADGDQQGNRHYRQSDLYLVEHAENETAVPQGDL